MLFRSEFPGINDEPMNLDGSGGLVSEFAILFKALRELARGVPDDQGNVTIQFYCSQRTMNEVPSKNFKGKEVAYSDSGIGKILSQYEKDLFEKKAFKIK